MGEKDVAYIILVGNPVQRDYSEDLGVNVGIILKWNF